jgi:hypothetical protein
VGRHKHVVPSLIQDKHDISPRKRFRHGLVIQAYHALKSLGVADCLMERLLSRVRQSLVAGMDWLVAALARAMGCGRVRDELVIKARS